MEIEDFVAIVFAMTSDEIDSLEYYWQCEKKESAVALVKSVYQRLKQEESRRELQQESPGELPRP